MLATLTVTTSKNARNLFLVTAIITVAIVFLANGVSSLQAASALTPIFVYLFNIQDYAGSVALLVILLVSVVVPKRAIHLPIMQWVGARPGTVALLCVVVLSVGAWTVYLHVPLCMDEYAPLFQSEIFASGHLTGKIAVPLLDWAIPPGFQNYFLNVSHLSGRTASSYWPAFALILTPFTLLGVPWLCNPLLSGLTVIAVHRLALVIFSNVESAGLAVLFTIASPVFFANGISFYAMPAHLLASIIFAWLLTEPTSVRSFAAGVVGSVALTLTNPLPHLLFGAPWIISMARRQGGRRLAGFLLVGYVPLCLLLGIGWFLFANQLAHEDVVAATGPRSLAAICAQILGGFIAPSSTVLLARLIGMAKVWAWSVPVLIPLALIGIYRWRHNRTCRLLAASSITTLVGYLFVTFDQGHGWGFRYFNSAWIVLPIGAAAALSRVPAKFYRGRPGPQPSSVDMAGDLDLRSFVVACVISTLTLGVGFRAVQMHQFIEEHWARLPDHPGLSLQVIFIDTSRSFYGADTVQNDPWLRGNEIRLLSRGTKADSDLMLSQFPQMHKVYADRFGSVWSR